MNDPARAVRPLFVEDADQLVKRVPSLSARSHVHDERKAGPPRDPDLSAEALPLGLPGGPLVPVVQPALPYRYGPRPGEPGLDSTFRLV